MSVRIALGGPDHEAAGRVVARLVDQRVASRITAQDETLWADPVPGRLAWTEAIANSVPLVDPVRDAHHALRRDGALRVVVPTADGAALAAAMIARTAGGEVTVGDRDPGTSLYVAAAADEAFIAAAAAALRETGADPARLVVVGPAAGPAGATAVPDDAPPVEGAYGALTAAALVPAALAGADLRELLAEAESEALNLAIDDPANNALLLGAVLAAAPAVAVVADGTHVVGFPVWASELLAETPGLDGAVSASPAPDGTGAPARTIRLVEDAAEHDGSPDVLLSGTLGELVLVWEYAATIASVLRTGADGTAA